MRSAHVTGRGALPDREESTGRPDAHADTRRTLTFQRLPTRGGTARPSAGIRDTGPHPPRRQGTSDKRYYPAVSHTVCHDLDNHEACT